MIVAFNIHGLDALVEGDLDVEDGPVPLVGWELQFDMLGPLRVDTVTGRYDELGNSSVLLDLSLTKPSDYWDAVAVVDFLKDNLSLTVFSKVGVAGWCRCRLCRHAM